MVTSGLSLLDERLRKIAAGWPPLSSAFALASVHIGVFMAVCAISYLRLPMGSSIAAVLFALTALASPMSGLLLVLTAVVFQYLFWFVPDDFYRIIGALSVAYVVRTLPNTLYEARRFSAQWLALAFFIALVFLHLYPPIGVGEVVTAIGFLLLAATIFLQVRNMAGKPEIAAVIATVCLSGFIAGVMGFIYIYLPVPQLFLSHSPLNELQLIDMRLIGAQDNPNGMAARLLPASVIVPLMMFLRRKPRSLWIVLFAMGAVLIAATATKSLMLALMVIGLILAYAAAKQNFLMKWSATLFAGVAVVVFFLAGVLPSLQARSADFWKQYSEPTLNTAYYHYLAKRSSSSWRSVTNLLGTLGREFRVGRVPQEPRFVLGKAGREVIYTPIPGARKDDLTQRLIASGERTRLLKTGLQVIADHPWWGVGHKGWPVVMERRLGFPFLSPHNGFIETWGAYGILGALLYLAIIIFAARNYWAIEKRENDPSLLWLNRGIAFYLLATLLREMVDVSSVLAVTPIALWGWAALGLQDGMARQYRSPLKAAQSLTSAGPSV